MAAIELNGAEMPDPTNPASTDDPRDLRAARDRSDGAPPDGGEPEPDELSPGAQLVRGEPPVEPNEPG